MAVWRPLGIRVVVRVLASTLKLFGAVGDARPSAKLVKKLSAVPLGAGSTTRLPTAVPLMEKVSPVMP